MFTAYDVAKITQSTEYPFAISKERFLNQLDQFREDFNNDKIILQRVEIRSFTAHDDFPTSILRLVFFEKQTSAEGLPKETG